MTDENRIARAALTRLLEPRDIVGAVACSIVGVAGQGPGWWSSACWEVGWTLQLTGVAGQLQGESGCLWLVLSGCLPIHG
jgi:hypothetical protein